MYAGIKFKAHMHLLLNNDLYLSPISELCINCMLLISDVLQILMNVLKANIIAVRVHTVMTQLEDFSVPVSMDTLEMDTVAVCCA